MSSTYEDAFNLLCGDKLGSGIHRDVYECRLRPDLVVKVEIAKDWRCFANVMEREFWNRWGDYQPVAKWLAPCYDLSPDGRILLQEKVNICSNFDTMPAELPAFLTDLKPSNFGWLKGQFVCADYAMTLDRPNVKPRKVHW